MRRQNIFFMVSLYANVLKKKKYEILKFNEQKNCKVMERRHHRRYNRSIVHKVRLIYVLLLFSID